MLDLATGLKSAKNTLRHPVEVTCRVRHVLRRAPTSPPQLRFNQEDRKAAALKAKHIAFPSPHWRQIRTNNPLERIIREVRRRTLVVGAFPDGQSALMLVAARLRHIAATKWGTKRYLAAELVQAPGRLSAA